MSVFKFFETWKGTELGCTVSVTEEKIQALSKQDFICRRGERKITDILILKFESTPQFFILIFPLYLRTSSNLYSSFLLPILMLLLFLKAEQKWHLVSYTVDFTYCSFSLQMKKRTSPQNSNKSLPWSLLAHLQDLMSIFRHTSFVA